MIQIITPPTGERYAEIQREVDGRFPAGRFVALESALVVTDAESHRLLVEKLQSLGKSPRNMLILQAGVDYPATGVIFAMGPVGDRYA